MTASGVRVYLDTDLPAEAVFRFEPEPDEAWRGIFADGLEDALGGRVRLEDGRLCVRKIDSLVEGLNGWWVNAVAQRAQATNTEWRRRHDRGDTELRARRPGFPARRRPGRVAVPFGQQVNALSVQQRPRDG